MGSKYKEYGGGPSTGLAEEFINLLRGGLTGSFGGGASMGQTNGADPVGSTVGVAGVLNDLFAGGGGNIGGSLMELISKDTNRQADALRARFGASGGQAFGTPAAYAESLLRSEQAPKLTNAIGGLQLNALQTLLPIFAGLSSKGITQRQGTLQENGWASAARIAAPIVGAGIGALAGNPMAGASVGSSLAGAFSGPQLPQLQTSPNLFEGVNLGFGNNNRGGYTPLFP